MMFDIRGALSSGNCASALELSKRLFESEYSNNEVRMLYASSYGCTAGVALYDLIDKVGSTDFSVNLFKALVQLFPSSSSTDTKMQSLWFMQDVLQTALIPGTVLSSFDSNVMNPYNTGSVLFRDRIDDANVLLLFSSMANVGVSLNRYGNPNLDYSQGTTLLSIWPNQTAVKNDPVHASCAIASAMTNWSDSVDAIKVIASGPLGTSLNAISIIMGQIVGGTTSAGYVKCFTDVANATKCERAYERLRYRESCYESDKDPDSISSYAVGILGGIDALW